MVEHVPLQPDFGGDGRADAQCAAAQRPLVDEHFELQTIEIEISPIEFTARQRITQRLEREHAPAQTPIVLMRRAGGRASFERTPMRLFAAPADARAISQAAEADVQLLCAETFGADLGQILQLEENFGLRPVAITVHDGLALFVVLCQCPRADALRVASAEAGATIGVEDVACAGFVEHRPDLQTLAQLPTAPVQDSAAPQQLRRFALIARALRQIVEV